MRMIDILECKRDGAELTKAEIDWVIEAYTDGSLPDYQMSALLMAILLRGMTRAEISQLTQAMVRSGSELRLRDMLGSYAVDKHSSGGVGDKTSLVVLPMVAACGVPVAKMSGRALGYTGGTLDKLESIAGFNVTLATERIARQAREVGLVIAGQSEELAPADGLIYALRDVTATVPSIPLIASSIMSKKIAAGADGIVLDVKVGEGAFMTELDLGRELAQQMVRIGEDAGRDVIAVISNMNQPLGGAVGNALEVREALDTLRGGGPEDLREHCLIIAGHMLSLAGQGKRWVDPGETRSALLESLDSGAALQLFRDMVVAQDGDARMVDEPDRLPGARLVETLAADRAGVVQSVPARGVIHAAFALGVGREAKGDALDHGTGLWLQVKVGQRVAEGEPLVTIHANSEESLARCRAELDGLIPLVDEEVAPLPLVFDAIHGRRQPRGAPSP
ncbi:MAG: thymidine phosphorylase [Anaerolineae bacterium]|nr:thymidine phosphorylase [Anaerolineae bacterium]